MGLFDSEEQPTAEEVAEKEDANQSASKLLDLIVLVKNIA